MFNPVEFQNLTVVKFVEIYKGCEKEIELIRLLQNNSLLPTRLFCRNCGNRMIERRVSKELKWLCSRRYCNSKYSLRKGSIFEKSHLRLWQIILLSIFWSISAGSSRGSSYDTIMKEAEVKHIETIVNWMHIFRDIAVKYFERHPRQLGGPGLIVEIDESLFAKRKYNRGRMVENQWIFGGYCRTSKKGFLVAVPDRSSNTLLPLVKRHIRPGSIIFSDMWGAYNGIESIEGANYIHKTVNHTRYFVDPVSGVHTNGIEGMWSRAKSKAKAMHGTSRLFINEYLAEFMFKQEDPENVLVQLWKIISELYPVNTQPPQLPAETIL